MSVNNRKEQRRRRHLRIRQRVIGTAARPRMAIFISNRHLYVQFIDDQAGNTLAATSTAKLDARCNRETAAQIGTAAASAAAAKGIARVVVDRGGFLFHGRVKAIVDAAVAAGLAISDQAAPAATEESK